MPSLKANLIYLLIKFKCVLGWYGLKMICRITASMVINVNSKNYMQYNIQNKCCFIFTFTVINSLNDVLQAKRTIVKCKRHFVTAYSKALSKKCYREFFFFFLQQIIVLIRKGAFLMYQYHEPKLVLQSNIKDWGQPFLWQVHIKTWSG